MRRSRSDASPAAPSTVTASDAAPDGAAAAHRSAAGGAEGLVSASGALEAQPARMTADSAATDRAASGRMRTVNLEMKGKGGLHLPACFLCPALGDRHARGGMEFGSTLNG